MPLTRGSCTGGRRRFEEVGRERACRDVGAGEGGGASGRAARSALMAWRAHTVKHQQLHCSTARAQTLRGAGSGTGRGGGCVVRCRTKPRTSSGSIATTDFSLKFPARTRGVSSVVERWIPVSWTSAEVPRSMGAQRSRVQLPYASFLQFLTYAHDTPCLSVRVAIFPSTFGAVFAQLWRCSDGSPAICARIRPQGNAMRCGLCFHGDRAAMVTRGGDLARNGACASRLPRHDCHVTSKGGPRGNFERITRVGERVLL